MHMNMSEFISIVGYIARGKMGEKEEEEKGMFSERKHHLSY